MRIRNSKMMKLLLSILCYVLLFASCGGNAKQDAITADETIPNQVKLKVKDKPRIIHVYLFGDFPTDLGKQMIKELQEVYPSVHYARQISLPDSAYYAPRNRYLAAKLLNTMMTLQSNNDMVLGMTTKDISLKYKEHENWGVMGLSYLNKRAAVISTYRLRIPSKRSEHLRKLMLHELGHVEGLPHCKVENCIMHDAEGQNRFSQLDDFCSSCKAVFKSKGWNMN